MPCLSTKNLSNRLPRSPSKGPNTFKEPNISNVKVRVRMRSPPLPKGRRAMQAERLLVESARKRKAGRPLVGAAKRRKAGRLLVGAAKRRKAGRLLVGAARKRKAGGRLAGVAKPALAARNDPVWQIQSCYSEI